MNGDPGYRRAEMWASLSNVAKVPLLVTAMDELDARHTQDIADLETRLDERLGRNDMKLDKLLLVTIGGLVTLVGTLIALGVVR